LLVVNLDIEALAAEISLRAPGLRRVEADLLARGAGPRTGSVDRLEQTAGELRDVHQTCVALQARQSSPSALAEQLAGARVRLLSAALELERMGWVAAHALEPYRQAHSHSALVRAVCGLASMLLAHWELVRDRTSVSVAELERALQQARDLSLMLQGKSGGGDALALALRERQQLFSLLLREYASLRRAAQALYGQQEAQRRVPSLYRASPLESAYTRTRPVRRG
jgi:hypothetical protein